MEDVQQRLIKCFSAVFPELTEEEIVKASADYTGNWDSLSAVTLLALVQEEFGIDLDGDGMENGISFEGLLARVNGLAQSVSSALPDQARNTQT